MNSGNGRIDRRLIAWGVHALTASGAVLGYLALDAAWHADTVWTFGWLLIALIVDGVDGPLARHFDIAAALPRIDGAALDLIVDYLTYVVAPVAYLAQAAFFLPSMRWPMAAFILVTSLYTFVRRDMKTEQSDFRGFPAVWNIAAAAFVVTNASQTVVAVAVVGLGLLTLTSIRIVHPLRVIQWRAATIAMSVVWLSVTGLLIARPDWRSGPTAILWWLPSIYFITLCTIRTMQPERKRGATGAP